jgi:hypothetical protein
MNSSTPGSSEEPTILIHGSLWKIRDIVDTVSERIQQNWRREKWSAIPALIHRTGGVSSQYRGQTFVPTKIDLVPGGWNHDHCVVCWWTLHETDNEEEGIGYRNDSEEWLCTECYKQFVNDNILRIK